MNAVEWRRNASTNTGSNTGAKRYRVRELRPASGYPNAREAEKEKGSSKAEKEQAQGLAFSLPASLAFRSLSLLVLPCQAIPCQASASDLRADNCEPFCI